MRRVSYSGSATVAVKCFFGLKYRLGHPEKYVFRSVNIHLKDESIPNQDVINFETKALFKSSMKFLWLTAHKTTKSDETLLHAFVIEIYVYSLDGN